MKIYTKTGDNLQTTTFKGRVYKNDSVIELEGTLDEATTSLALARTFVKDNDIKNLLEKIILKMFDLGSEILGYTKDKVTLLDSEEFEKIIDEYSQKMESQKSFIIPGTTKSGAFIHTARTNVRRLERRIVDYALENSVSQNNFVSQNILKYINRLSDLLFTLGKWEDLISE